MLSSIYTGRTSLDNEIQDVSGYSDVYMDSMAHGQPGKKEKTAPFEIVDESQLDFANFKDRAEFRDELGGDGELYGRPADALRRGSGHSSMTNLTGYIAHDRSRSDSRDSERTRVDGGAGGTTYPSGYHKASSALRDQSPANSLHGRNMSSGGGGAERGRSVDSQGRLLMGAARMGRSPPAPTPGGYGPVRGMGFGEYRAGAEGYNTPPAADAESPGEDTSYDYFRRGRGL